MAGTNTTLFTDFFSRPVNFFMVGSCASLATSRAEEALGRDWSHIADFNKLGTTLLGFLDFYNVHGVVNTIRAIGLHIYEAYQNPTQLTVRLQLIAGLALNGFSKAMQLLGRLEKLESLKDWDISRFKLYGNFAGMGAHAYNVYWVGSSLNRNVYADHIQGPHKAAYQDKKYWERVGQVAFSVGAIALNFFLAAGALWEGAAKGLQKVAFDHHKDGILASFVLMTAASVAQHVIGAEKFAKQHKA